MNITTVATGDGIDITITDEDGEVVYLSLSLEEATQIMNDLSIVIAEIQSRRTNSSTPGYAGRDEQGGSDF